MTDLAEVRHFYCDASHHPDLYWAARGSGPGFFGVVTASHLRIYPKPPVCGSSLYVYPLDAADEIYNTTRAISAEVDRRADALIAVPFVPRFATDAAMARL
ncbi:MAG: hypothetical protein WCE30_19025 [Mycobacterium sp.]